MSDNAKRVTDVHLRAVYESQFRHSGLSFPEFRETVCKNQAFLAGLARLQAAHSLNPYPEAVTAAEKVSAHYDELSFLVSERLAAQLEGRSAIEAQRTMNERYISSVLDAQLDNMTSGVDPVDFFEKIGIPEPAQSYSAFKKDMVGAISKTWEDYLAKPHVTRFTAVHMRNYFVKHLGENLQVPISRLAPSSRTGQVGKRLPRTAKLGSAEIESPLPTAVTRKFRAAKDVGKQVFDDDDGEQLAKNAPVAANSRVFAVGKKAQSLDSSIGCKSLTKQRKPSHDGHHSLLEHLHHHHSSSVACQKVDCLMFRANRRKWAFEHKNAEKTHKSSSSSSSSSEDEFVMPPPLAPRSEPTAVPEPTEDSELSASDEAEAAPAAAEEPTTAAAAPPTVASRSGARRAHGQGTYDRPPAKSRARPHASVSLGMLESYAKSNPEILDARRPVFLAPVDTYWASTPAAILSGLQARPKNFLAMHMASPVTGSTDQFLTKAGRQLSLSELTNHAGEQGNHSVERTTVAGKQVTLIYLGKVVPRN